MFWNRVAPFWHLLDTWGSTCNVSNGEEMSNNRRIEALEHGRSLLDEATENITFEEFDWAFEEVWAGVASILNAFHPHPAETLILAPKGEVPTPGSLFRILAALPRAPKNKRVVADLEKLRGEHSRLSAEAFGKRVEQIVFDAWLLHDECGQNLQLEDDRLDGRLIVPDPSPGRVGGRVIERRTALKLLLASSVMPAAACSKIEADSKPVAEASAAKVEKTRLEGAKAKRVSPIQGMNWPTSDPFLFCAYHQDDYPSGNENMGPAASLDGRHIGRDFEGKDNWRMYHGREVPGFPRHPHRGFETVTVVRSGMLDHADSLGATARYGAGDVQWLTAGGGIQHAEMFPLLRSDSPNPLELFQIWMNLPRSNKMVNAHFKMLWSEKIPRISVQDSKGRLSEITLAAGEFQGHRPPTPPPDSWASQPGADVAIYTVRMEAGAQVELPAVNPGTWRSLYVHRGVGAKVSGVAVSNLQRVEFEESGPISLEALGAETEILVLQGRPIGEPVAKRGPFVMNTHEEIQQAYRDYQQTQFGGWPWQGNGPVHQRNEGRFAIHPDGRREEPV